MNLVRHNHKESNMNTNDKSIRNAKKSLACDAAAIAAAKQRFEAIRNRMANNQRILDRILTRKV